MATAHASVADIRPWQLGQPREQLHHPSWVKKMSFSSSRFPRPCLVAAINFPHTKWLPKITDYRDTAALRACRFFFIIKSLSPSFFTSVFRFSRLAKSCIAAKRMLLVASSCTGTSFLWRNNHVQCDIALGCWANGHSSHILELLFICAVIATRSLLALFILGSLQVIHERACLFLPWRIKELWHGSKQMYGKNFIVIQSGQWKVVRH